MEAHPKVIHRGCDPLGGLKDGSYSSGFCVGLGIPVFSRELLQGKEGTEPSVQFTAQVEYAYTQELGQFVHSKLLLGDRFPAATCSCSSISSGY